MAQANVIINEVQLSPTEERFIELYNSGNSAVDLTGWYIQRKTASGSNFGSLVSKTYFEGKNIKSRGYFLISKTELGNSNIINNNLTLTESNAIQLKNSSQELIDKVGWGDVGDCGSVCAPNPTAGKSIQRTSSGNWIITLHTPGASNLDTNDDADDESDTSDNDDDSTSSSSSLSSTEKVLLPLKITTKIISPKTIVAGIPFSLGSLTTTNRGETYAVGKWVWNFGDGSAKEVGESEPFEYSYEYPGEYALTLSYFDSYLNKTPDVVDKITVKVVPAEVYISSVGNIADPYIEIENKSSYEIILSNWIVTAGSHYFIIPEGTTLLSNKKIKLSPKITGFVGSDIGFVTITDPNKEITATYPSQTKKLSSRVSSVNKVIPYLNQIPTEDKLQDVSSSKDSQIINLDDLEASASESGVGISKSISPFIGLLIVIGIGITSFIIIRKREVVNDYVEDKISPQDMTIME